MPFLSKMLGLVDCEKQLLFHYKEKAFLQKRSSRQMMKNKAYKCFKFGFQVIRCRYYLRSRKRRKSQTKPFHISFALWFRLLFLVHFPHRIFSKRRAILKSQRLLCRARVCHSQEFKRYNLHCLPPSPSWCIGRSGTSGQHINSPIRLWEMGGWGMGVDRCCPGGIFSKKKSWAVADFLL
jgi:hypothetical protein